jgi:hypothetical protein
MWQTFNKLYTYLLFLGLVSLQLLVERPAVAHRLLRGFGRVTGLPHLQKKNANVCLFQLGHHYIHTHTPSPVKEPSFNQLLHLVPLLLTLLPLLLQHLLRHKSTGHCQSLNEGLDSSLKYTDKKITIY